MAFRPFPKMIYHETMQPKVVMNQDELNAAIRDGWSATKVAMSELKIMKERRDALQKEIDILNMKIGAIENMNDVPEEKPAPEPEVRQPHEIAKFATKPRKKNKE